MSANSNAVVPAFHLVDPVPEYAGSKIRVLVDEANGNAPWFVVPDLSKAIGLKGSSAIHIRRLDRKDVGVLSKHTLKWRGSQPLIVSEPGFYELVLGSRKPGAVAFKRWVCSEVLPAIRRYGRYEALADEDDNPVDVPDVMVEMVNLTRRLPNGNITETDVRIHVWEYLDERGIILKHQQRAKLGKIARRFMLNFDLPVLRKWGAGRKHGPKTSIQGESNVYPEAILDMAYQEFLKGHVD